jgi:hypothetical protein
MTDFFGALEQELAAAATRRPRRAVGVAPALGAVAVVGLLALAVAGAAIVFRGGDGDGSTSVAGAREPDPVGTVIPKGEGKPPVPARALVVASGVAPITGPWQIEVSRTKGERNTRGEVTWHRGYCLTLNLLHPPRDIPGGRSGFCGAPRSLGFRKTPGFSRAQPAFQSKPRQRSKEVLVWGRVPDRAETVVVTARGGTRIEVRPTDGPKSFPGRFYAVPVKPGLPGARINWLDANGHPGSRGIRLMPPITRY